MSIGTTLLTSPISNALKYHIQDEPVASPDRIKKIKDFGVIAVIVFAESTMNTMTHEKSKTTMVRSAVAISESVFLMPHLANTEVSPEKKADNTAMESQSISIHAPPQISISRHRF